MEYLYARVSTLKQDNDSQVSHIKGLYPNAIIVTETVSGMDLEKPALDALLARLSPGDTLIVAALDRLGRRVGQALLLIEDLYARDIKVISIRENMDYSSAAGRFTITLMLAIARMERDLTSDRTKRALAAKKASGVRLGRPPRIPVEVVDRIRALRQSGNSLRVIGTAVGYSAMHVSRVLAKLR